MQFNYKQSQFELFPGAVKGSTKSQSPQFLFSSITLSLENIVISGIVTLMVVIFSFSAGVEKGKKAYLGTASDNFEQSTASVAQNRQPVSGPLAKSKPVVLSASIQSPQIFQNPSKAGVATDALAAKANSDSRQVVSEEQGDLSGSYTVQVASFKKDEHAQKEALMLKKKGYDILILPKGSYSIVCVGKFSQKEQASVFLSRLKKTYKDCVIRRL